MMASETCTSDELWFPLACAKTGSETNVACPIAVIEIAADNKKLERFLFIFTNPYLSTETIVAENGHGLVKKKIEIHPTKSPSQSNTERAYSGNKINYL